MAKLLSWRSYWVVWGLIGHVAVAAAAGYWLYPKRHLIISEVRLLLHDTPSRDLDIRQIVQTWQERRQADYLDPGDRQPPKRLVQVSDTAQLTRAIKEARPGDRIELSPGIYRLKGKYLAVNRPGEFLSGGIEITSAIPWRAELELDMLEGFWVTAPYWRFSGLTIRGVCKSDSRCEHAFHIVGNAHHTELRGNRISGFNAPVKINGSNGKWPDNGVIAGNTFYNPAVRDTGNPVTLIDAVGVDSWLMEANLIANFKKGRGDNISYGAFFKGGGSGNRVSRNIVLCSDKVTSKHTQVGLSFGGGGTGTRSCRNKDCSAEQRQSLIAGNLVMHCSDVGIYLNRSKNTLIVNNTLYGTLGIDVRFPASEAVIVNNLFSGRTKSRDGGVILLQGNNWQLPVESVFRRDFGDWFKSPWTLDFSPEAPIAEYPRGGAGGGNPAGYLWQRPGRYHRSAPSTPARQPTAWRRDPILRIYGSMDLRHSAGARRTGDQPLIPSAVSLYHRATLTTHSAVHRAT